MDEAIDKILRHGHGAKCAVGNDTSNTRISTGRHQCCDTAATDSVSDQWQVTEHGARSDKFQHRFDIGHFVFGNPVDRRIPGHCGALSLTAKIHRHHNIAMPDQCIAVASCHPVISAKFGQEQDQTFGIFPIPVEQTPLERDTIGSRDQQEFIVSVGCCSHNTEWRHIFKDVNNAWRHISAKCLIARHHGNNHKE